MLLNYIVNIYQLFLQKDSSQLPIRSEESFYFIESFLRSKNIFRSGQRKGNTKAFLRHIIGKRCEIGVVDIDQLDVEIALIVCHYQRYCFFAFFHVPGSARPSSQPSFPGALNT